MYPPSKYTFPPLLKVAVHSFPEVNGYLN